MDKDALIKDVKELLRWSIASNLKINKADYDGSLEKRAVVNKWLSVVMAIGCNETVDAATDSLCEQGSFFNTNAIPRRIVQKEVEAGWNIFRFEVAGLKKVHEMNRRRMEPMEIWNHLISIIRPPHDYQDGWLEQHDARRLRFQDSKKHSDSPPNFALVFRFMSSSKEDGDVPLGQLPEPTTASLAQ